MWFNIKLFRQTNTPIKYTDASSRVLSSRNDGKMCMCCFDEFDYVIPTQNELIYNETWLEPYKEPIYWRNDCVLDYSFNVMTIICSEAKKNLFT